jgi:hypothetical protein
MKYEVLSNYFSITIKAYRASSSPTLFKGKNIMKNWQVKTEMVASNFLGKNDKPVPQKTLRDDEFGLTIICRPYRIIFEPCIPYDNCCRMEVRFDNEFPQELLNILSYMDSLPAYKHFPPKHKDHYKQYFFIDGSGDKEMGVILNVLQGFLIRKVPRAQHQKMLAAIDVLRQFIRLPSKINYLPVHSHTLFRGRVTDQIHYQRSISAWEMAKSTFGQGTHTAHALSKSNRR